MAEGDEISQQKDRLEREEEENKLTLNLTIQEKGTRTGSCKNILHSLRRLLRGVLVVCKPEVGVGRLGVGVGRPEVEVGKLEAEVGRLGQLEQVGKPEERGQQRLGLERVLPEDGHQMRRIHLCQLKRVS